MGEQASLEFDLSFGDVLLHKLVQAYYITPNYIVPPKEMLLLLSIGTFLTNYDITSRKF